MKILKALTESVLYLTVTSVCIGVLLALAVWASRHITCVNIFDKVCFVY